MNDMLLDIGSSVDSLAMGKISPYLIPLSLVQNILFPTTRDVVTPLQAHLAYTLGSVVPSSSICQKSLKCRPCRLWHITITILTSIWPQTCTCAPSQRTYHCMKSGIFVSMRHCRLTWNFRFATARGNLQATPKTAMNCRKLTWALLGSCPPMTPLPLILGEALTCKWKCCELYKCKSG